jgi:hypothetical protein
MAGLVPAIHVFLSELAKTWMPGTSPGMTSVCGLYPVSIGSDSSFAHSPIEPSYSVMWA